MNDLIFEIKRLQVERNILAKRIADFEIACTALCPHGLDIAAEKENMRRERDTLAALLKEAQYFVPSGLLRDRIDSALKETKP